MTDKAKQSGGGNGKLDVGNGQAEMVSMMNGVGVDTFAKACQAYFSGWATLNGELAGFMARRLNRDAELSSKLAQCRDWQQAAELQREWAQSAAEEYAEEANRLVEISSSVASEQWKPVMEQAEKAMTEAKLPKR